MNIELTASKADPLVGGNYKLMKIDCTEEDYKKALEILEKFASEK